MWFRHWIHIVTPRCHRTISLRFSVYSYRLDESVHCDDWFGSVFLRLASTLSSSLQLKTVSQLMKCKHISKVHLKILWIFIQCVMWLVLVHLMQTNRVHNVYEWTNEYRNWNFIQIGLKRIWKSRDFCQRIMDNCMQYLRMEKRYHYQGLKVFLVSHEKT